MLTVNVTRCILAFAFLLTEPRWPNLFAHVNRKTGCATNQLRIFCFVPCIHSNQHSTPSAKSNFCGRVVCSSQQTAFNSHCRTEISRKSGFLSWKSSGFSFPQWRKPDAITWNFKHRKKVRHARSKLLLISKTFVLQMCSACDHSAPALLQKFAPPDCQLLNDGELYELRFWK